MADQVTSTYRIIIEMGDNGWWTVDVPDVPGAHTEAQTLARARRNAREVIALMLNLPRGAEDTMELEERLALPDDVGACIERARSLRAEAERVNEALRAASADALAMVEKQLPQIGIRDQAELLGVSFQRIAQLRPGAPRRGRRAAPVV